MTNARQTLGRWGEALAADYLAGKGYAIIARNQRTLYGEIDLVTQVEEGLVFVEVKTRSTDVYGPPEAAITPQKRKHLIASAQAYIQANYETEPDWRIDVIAIRKPNATSQPEIMHFENAIR